MWKGGSDGVEEGFISDLFQIGSQVYGQKFNK